MESQAIRDLIAREELSLLPLNSYIHEMKSDIEKRERSLEEHESNLRTATQALCSAKSTISFLKDLRGENILSNDAPVHAPSSRFLYSRDMSLAVPGSHKDLLDLANSFQRDASTKAIESQNNVDCDPSILYFLNKSLASSLEEKARIEERIVETKDLATSRRRIPEELWVQIFTERVIEDERHYVGMRPYIDTPLTVLRLTWVCKLWRAIITEQPSLWKYIPIPRSEQCSRKFLCMIEHFRERLKSISPIVYTVSGWQGGSTSGLFLYKALKQFHFLESLELHVSNDSYAAENLVEHLGPKTQQLVLVNPWTEDSEPRDINREIDRRALINVRKLTCSAVQFTIVGQVLQEDDPSRVSTT
ncbi:hypothetical protein CPB86DRAFT_815214 [Serendipita vermifera]|nr:hypothetical protein CPB86DRAFT_815214 [Serendipita vermifera]